MVGGVFTSGSIMFALTLIVSGLFVTNSDLVGKGMNIVLALVLYFIIQYLVRRIYVSMRVKMEKYLYILSWIMSLVVSSYVYFSFVNEDITQVDRWHLYVLFVLTVLSSLIFMLDIRAKVIDIEDISTTRVKTTFSRLNKRIGRGK